MYFPGELSSLAISHDGKYLACSSLQYPDAKIVNAQTGEVETRLYDSFAAGSQPLQVRQLFSQ